VIAKTPVQNVAPTQDGRAIDAYVTNANRGTWLFQPDQNGGGNRGGRVGLNSVSVPIDGFPANYLHRLPLWGVA
jgi:hypothetical protein